MQLNSHSNDVDAAATDPTGEGVDCKSSLPSEDKYPPWTTAQRRSQGSAGRSTPVKASDSRLRKPSRADSGWGKKDDAVETENS